MSAVCLTFFLVTRLWKRYFQVQNWTKCTDSKICFGRLTHNCCLIHSGTGFPNYLITRVAFILVMEDLVNIDKLKLCCPKDKIFAPHCVHRFAWTKIGFIIYIYIIILIFIELISFNDFVGNNLFIVCLFVCLLFYEYVQRRWYTCSYIG